MKQALQSKLRTLTMVLALLAIWAVFQWATDGAFLQTRNLSNLFRQMSVVGIMASGMVLVIVAGHIDLSVGSVVCFLGALLAVLHVQHAWPLGLAVAATLGAGLLIGVAQGFILSYQRVPAFIVTLGGMMIFRGASMWVTGSSTIPLPESWVLSLGTGYLPSGLGWMLVALAVATLVAMQISGSARARRLGVAPSHSWASVAVIAALLVGFMAVMAQYQGVPLPVLAMLAVTLTLHAAATRTVWGRHVFAIGGNPDAAYLSGVPVKRQTLFVFLLMGALSSVAGIILTARVGSASPDAGQLLELDAIASCVIGGTSLLGGRGTVLGAILGALVMESLNNGMSMANLEPFWQYIVKGVVLVIAVWADLASQARK
jgi:D-xylose transport system permease protein